MNSPPTLTNSANVVGSPSAANCASVSQIASGVLVQGTDSRYLFCGGEPAVVNTIGQQIENINFPAGPFAYVQAVEFQWNGSVDGRFEFYLSSNPDPLNLLIDGKYINSSLANWTMQSGGNTFDLLVDFGGVTGTHTIRVEMGQAPNQFYGVRTNPGNVISAPTLKTPKDSRIFLLFGDSWIGPSPQTSTPLNGPVPNLGKLLGYQNTDCSGSGGTGYLATNTGAGYKYRDRAPFDIYPYNSQIDCLVILGSINDPGSFTPSQIQTEAQLFYAAIRSNGYTGPVVVFGIQNVGIDYTTSNNAVAAAVATQRQTDPNIWFIDQSAYGAANGLSWGTPTSGYITAGHPTDTYSPILANLYWSALRQIFQQIP